MRVLNAVESLNCIYSSMVPRSILLAFDKRKEGTSPTTEVCINIEPTVKQGSRIRSYPSNMELRRQKT